jgi:hypothetical protein
MTTSQQNKLTMLQNVLRFLQEAGAPLAAIKRIGAGRDALATLVEQVAKAADAQDRPTTGVSRSRETVKAEAAEKAEVLRLLVVALTEDPTQRAALKTPLSKRLNGKDADFLTYAADVANAVGTLKPADLKDAGYDPAVLATLRADVAELTDTQGAARQIQAGTTTATDQLADLLKQASAVLDDTLDPLVGAQALAQPALVAQYNEVRRTQHTAARRRPRYRGVAGPGAPVLVFDRREAGLPAPTLGNRSGRGVQLRFYTAAAPTARPAAGQGVVVKHKTDVHLDSYAKLNADPDAPFLLVVLEGVDGEGRWLVE